MDNVNLKASPETRAQILQLIALEKLENDKDYTIKSYLEMLVGLAAHNVSSRYAWPIVTTGHQLNAGQFALKSQAIMAKINVADLSTPAALDNFRGLYLGRKGRLADLFDELRRVPNAQRREVGQLLNKIKQGAQERFDQAQAALENNK